MGSNCSQNQNKKRNSYLGLRHLRLINQPRLIRLPNPPAGRVFILFILVGYFSLDFIDMMPADNRKEDNFYNSIPEQIVFHEMDTVVDDDDDDEEFNFSSDDETDVNDNQFLDDPYRDYELLSQDPVNGNNGDNNRLYSHSVMVNWIETDDPLFDREAFEIQQRRQVPSTNMENDVGEHSNNPNDTDKASTEKLDEGNILKGIFFLNFNLFSSFNLEKISIIKNLMSNFKLPTESYPGWAKELPEEQWKSFFDRNTKE